MAEAVFMNAGAYGGEIAHVLVSCSADSSGPSQNVGRSGYEVRLSSPLVQETGDIVIC